MDTKTYVFWCFMLTGFAVGCAVEDFFICAGAAVILCILYRVSVRILDKIDSKRNKNEENEEDKN